MPEQPNILLIIADQQRADTVGFSGKTACRTPNLDRLARQGIAFAHALTPCPLCAPARAAIFTGQYPHQVDMLRNDTSLRAAPTLTDRLRGRGYHTAYAGKWHLDAQTPPYLLAHSAAHDKTVSALAQWFDRSAGESVQEYTAWCARNGLPDGWAFNDLALRTTRQPAMSIPKTGVLQMGADQTIDGWITEHALRLLSERPRGRPFFLVCGFQGPHPPFKIPEPYYSRYDPRDIPEPPNFYPAPHKPRANTTSYYHQLWLDHGEHWAAWQKSVAVYWGFVTLLDEQVGRLVSALERENVLDDTLVIFTSDHGEMLGQHGLWHKMMPYEEAVRVPLVMRYPRRIAAGARSDALVSLVDLAPTLLSVAGEPIPDEMTGIDLSPAFGNRREFQREPYRFSEHQPLGAWHNTVAWRMVVDPRWKYVWNQGDLGELYDLESDPFELRNRIDEPGLQSQRAHLRSVLREWMAQTVDPLLAHFDAEVR